MFLRTQRLLFLGTHQLVAYRWQAGVLHDEGRFVAGPEGYAAFAAYLVQNPKSTYRLLVNVAEEGYQTETIPYLHGNDRQAIITRKLGQYFFGAELTCARSLGHEKAKRKNERLLLCALPNNAFFAPWLTALAASQVSLASIHSVAQLAPLLLAKLRIGNTRCLVLTIQDQSIRQSYLEDGELHFSRLSPLQNSSQAGIAQAFASEAIKLQQYLTSQRLISRQQSLTAYILAHPSTHKSIGTSCIDTPNLRFSLIDSVDAARRTGLKDAPRDSFSDLLLLNLLANTPPPQQFANDTQRHLHQLDLVRGSFLGGGALALLGCLLFTGHQLYAQHEIKVQGADLRSEAQLARMRYDDIARTFPPLPTDSASLRSLIDRYAEFERRATTPAGLFAEISRALNQAPAVELDTIDWQLGEPVAGKQGSSGPAQNLARLPEVEHATLRAHLRLGANSSARRMLEIFDQFVLTLRANPSLQVEILQRPVDIESGKALKGTDLEADDDKLRTFSLRLSRKLAP